MSRSNPFLFVVSCVAWFGCDPGVQAPADAPAQEAATADERASDSSSAPEQPQPPQVEPQPPQVEPEPLPPGLAARVEPIRPAASSPYPAHLDTLLASPPSEPLVADADADDPAAWAKAGQALLAKHRHADAIHAYARASKLAPMVWQHSFELARAAVAAGDEETAKLALAHSYLLDIGKSAVHAWDGKDFKPIWSKSWFTKLGVGKISAVLGNPTDWQPHGLQLDGVTVRFLSGDPVMLQIHADVDIVDAARERDWIVWATSCKQGDRVYAELGSLNHRFLLNFAKQGSWQRPAAVSYAPSLAFTSEPEACEFRFYRSPAAVASEPLTEPPTWLADFCWTARKPGDAGMAREGRCFFERSAKPDAPLKVESLDVKRVDKGKWSELEQTFEATLGDAVGQWKTVALDTTCTCGSAECERSESGTDKLRDHNLWFAEAGERVRLREVTAYKAGQQISHCSIEIGTRGPHPWGEYGQWTRELDVVARYCWRDDVVREGACS